MNAMTLNDTAGSCENIRSEELALQHETGEPEDALSSFSEKALLLINPVAGRKYPRRPFLKAIRLLMDSGYLPSVLVSSGPGELREYAARIGPEYSLLVCAGGDGSLHEVVNGLAENDLHVPVGLIPCGSTNDYAMSRKISTDTLQATSAICSGRTRHYDIGRFNGQFFTYLASFGAFTWFGYTTDQTLKNLIGFAAYLQDSAKNMLKLKPIPMRITVDEVKFEGNYLFGAICSTESIGGILHFPANMVDLSDGKLEMFLIRNPDTFTELEILIMDLLAGDYSNPHVHITQGKHFLVENPTGGEWSLDGESSGKFQKAEITAVQGFLELRA